MTRRDGWRPLSPQESAVIRAIVSGADNADIALLADELDGALVPWAADWILDVRPLSTGQGSGLPGGPLAARAFVPNQVSYKGEVIIWFTDGHLSGLEYAWISDELRTRWPLPNEMEIPRGDGRAP